MVVNMGHAVYKGDRWEHMFTYKRLGFVVMRVFANVILGIKNTGVSIKRSSQ